MMRIDIDAAIRQHNMWRRHFLNAFAGGNYADMPLSEHRGCTLDGLLAGSSSASPLHPAVTKLHACHDRFHWLANEIIELSENGLGHSADLLLPELNEAAHQLVAALDQLRQLQTP